MERVVLTTHSGQNLYKASASSNYIQITNSDTGSGSGDGFLIGVASDEAATIWNQENTRMVFGTNGTERMRIDSSGGVLIGKTSGGSTNTGCEFGGGGTGGLAFNITSTNECFTYNNNNSSGATYPYNFRQNNTSKGQIQVSSTSTTYVTSSDARLKDVTGEARGLEVINELNPVSYNWKADGKADEGLIAQEVQEIVPNAVSGSEEEMYQMDYSKLVVHLVKGMKEQQAQIEALQSEINKLKGE